ncbi:MAG: putative tannase/feruloyl esterase, partial [Rhodoferax sp.]|nr:putative tannase/feruloyl esterase [Rhodoferax sp.]
QVALELQDPTLAQASFLNAKGNGADGWKNLSYAQLNTAWDLGITLQPRFANINTDSTDLSVFRDRGGKVLSYHGLADVLVPPQGTINYYNRVATAMGGVTAVQNFYRLYLVPGMSHGFGNGSAVDAAVPLPSNDDLYGMLTNWVEKGIAPPSRVDVSSAASTSFPTVATRPICLYPLKPTYTAGSATAAASYGCS